MSKIDEIKRLKDLLDQGALTEEEFRIMKNEVMNTPTNQQKESQLPEIKPVVKKDSKQRNPAVPGVKTSSGKSNNNYWEPGNDHTAFLLKIGILSAIVSAVSLGLKTENILLSIIAGVIFIGSLFFFPKLINRMIIRNLSLAGFISLFVIVTIIPFGTGNSSYSSSTDSYAPVEKTRNCQWCGKSYTGNGYFHLLDDCVPGDPNLGTGGMCSKKCCMDSWNASH